MPVLYATRTVHRATPATRTARGTSPRRLSTASNARGPDSLAARASSATQRRRPASIATGGRSTPTTAMRSSVPASLRIPLQGFFRVADVVQGQLTRLDEPRHHRFGMTVEKREQVADQPGVRLVTGNDSVEDVRVADAFHAPERLFLLEAVHHRPHGG